MQMLFSLSGFVGAQHISVLSDINLHLVQKVSQWQSFLKWSPPQAEQWTRGFYSPFEGVCVLVLGWTTFFGWAPCELFTWPHFNDFFGGSWCSVNAFTIFTLPLLWVRYDVFKPNPPSVMGVDVGSETFGCCWAVFQTSGMEL